MTRINKSIIEKKREKRLKNVIRAEGSSAEIATTEKEGDSKEDREEDKKKADEYSSTMQQAMGDAALTYRHELGMNYAFVLPDLIVGSCLQKAGDVDRLRDEAKVETVLCLQQDPDLAYFGLELPPIVDRIKERGDLKHIRHEIRDFDPFSLRVEVPQAVAKLHSSMRKGGVGYVHCTAGLGRAPAVALAYMWWLRGFQLDEANALLQKVRRCSPKLLAIRAATVDILSGGATEPVELSWRNRGTPKKVEIAGLDVGWHNKLPLEFVAKEGRWVVNRQLPIGTYYYKYVIDDHWTTNPDAVETPPDSSGMVNNVLDVVGGTLNTPAWETRKRLMKEDAPLTDEDRKIIVEKLNAMADAYD